jgi:hypothetical protein
VLIVVVHLTGPGKCDACGTFYNTEGFSVTSSIGDEPIYIRVVPNFPERGLGGDVRDQEKENQIEADVLQRLEIFIEKGDEKKINFIWKLVSACARRGVSINSADNSNILSYLKAQHSRDGNQSCLLRLLPELMAKGEIWTDVVTSVLADDAIGVDDFKAYKKQLEVSMGFLVPLDDSQEQAPTDSSEKIRKVSKRKKILRKLTFGLLGN